MKGGNRDQTGYEEEKEASEHDENKNDEAKEYEEIFEDENTMVENMLTRSIYSLGGEYRKAEERRYRNQNRKKF